MIGNDLVDLDLAKTQSNWHRRGYLDKIFTAHEQEMIKTANCPDETVWMLWSMKESAYKIHNRRTGIRNFAPTSLNCSISRETDVIKGIVNVNAQTYFTESTIHSTYVHTIATIVYNQLKEIEVAIYKFPENLFDYKSTAPGCVSHHGRYLALVY